MGRYLQIAKEVVNKGRVGTKRPGSGPLSVDYQKDPYLNMLQTALRAVCQLPYPPGMLLWLEQAHPSKYLSLTVEVPNRIEELWRAHAPLQQFHDVLDRWVETFREADALFQVAGDNLQ